VSMIGFVTKFVERDLFWNNGTEDRWRTGDIHLRKLKPACCLPQRQSYFPIRNKHPE
jgi:hypothetical protein